MNLFLARARNEETALLVSGLKKELGYENLENCYPNYRGTTYLLFRYCSLGNPAGDMWKCPPTAPTIQP